MFAKLEPLLDLDQVLAFKVLMKADSMLSFKSHAVSPLPSLALPAPVTADKDAGLGEGHGLCSAVSGPP